MIVQLDNFISKSALKYGNRYAIEHKDRSIKYDELLDLVSGFATGLHDIGFKKSDRVAVYLGKQIETVVAFFGVSMAGGVFVPINPVLKPRQVLHILRDCGASLLVTSESRLQSLQPDLDDCKDLRYSIVVDSSKVKPSDSLRSSVPWQEVMSAHGNSGLPRVIATDMAAILYTSGSTGNPKGVILSHLNLTVGAMSVAGYLHNTPEDRILAALPLSFDAGLSQVTTAMHVGARAVLHEHLLPRDIVRIVKRKEITGITGVPPFWIQVASEEWPDEAAKSVRYFANTGGKMPFDTLTRLRQIFPEAEPYLMYGLTEAFRSTFLPPAEVDRRPDSIGKAIPNAEVLVVQPNGEVCPPDVPGELVHRGPLVAMGYWNDPDKTAERFKPAPNTVAGISIPEMAVWSGDTVRTDSDGFIYFVSRSDEMIKTSGYRVSPTEIEEVAYDSGLVAEAAAIGLPHEQLGQIIVLVAKAKPAIDQPTTELLQYYKAQLPGYMTPAQIYWQSALPRNANGKLDRKTMTIYCQDRYSEEQNP